MNFNYQIIELTNGVLCTLKAILNSNWTQHIMLIKWMTENVLSYNASVLWNWPLQDGSFFKHNGLWSLSPKQNILPLHELTVVRIWKRVFLFRQKYILNFFVFELELEYCCQVLLWNKFTLKMTSSLYKQLFSLIVSFHVKIVSAIQIFIEPTL